MTPEGLKREHEVDRSQSITPHTGKKLNLVITGMLVLALGYFVFDKFVLSEYRDPAPFQVPFLQNIATLAVIGEPPSVRGPELLGVEAVNPRKIDRVEKREGLFK